MNHLYENVAYLRGLAEGLDIDDSKKGKLFTAIIDTLDEMASAINILNEDIDDLDEYVDAIDEDLTDLEDDFYDDDIDDDYCDIECPECGELIFIDDPLLCDPALGDTVIDCPVCDATISLADCDCCAGYDDLYDYDFEFDERLLDIEDDADESTEEDEEPLDEGEESADE